MDSIRLKARAKINLGLDVLGKREDGYHEVRMVMQTIGIYDRLILTKIPEEEIRITSNLAFLPVNENNLIYKAIKLLKDEYHFPGGISVDLNKFIPVAAGMAGGSTDAASTMFGVNRLFGLNLSMGKMMELGVRLGADVPYCVMRGTALAEGIGEKLTRITPVPHMWILIAKPQINVSTRLVYEQLDMGGIQKHPDIDGIIRAIEAQDVVRIAQSMGNVLENVTVPLYPVIETIKQDMLSHGAINAMMSGSGPTVFGIFDDRSKLREATEALRNSHLAKTVFATQIYNKK
mgnify:FL=1